MIRHYIAIVDTGHDYLQIEYTSEYRNNSKNNLQDCKNTMKRKWNKVYKIIQTIKI